MAEQEGSQSQKPKRPPATCPCCGTAIETASARAGYRRWQRRRLGLVIAAGVSFVVGVVLWASLGRTAWNGPQFLGLGILISANLLAIPKGT
jgi:hypothetical protein